MRKALGLALLLAALIALAAILEGMQGRQNFLSLQNFRNLLPWVGLYGILALGQAVVIITGGIDLSVGSVIALVGITAGLLLNPAQGAAWHPALVIPLCLGLGVSIGLAHGILVTYARMQPFVVTLCGLFFYRGIARVAANDMTQGFGNNYPLLQWWGGGSLADALPPGASPALRDLLALASAPLLVMLALAAILAAWLHFAPGGRHLFALGANEDAARLSGVRTRRLKIAAYVLCSLITSIGALLFAFKVNSMGPSNFGSFAELYAIAGAVLGGCSLRGGTGNVLGILFGVALIRILANLVNILGIPSQLEYVVIGGAILIMIALDEFLTRRRLART